MLTNGRQEDEYGKAKVSDGVGATRWNSDTEDRSSWFIFLDFSQHDTACIMHTTSDAMFLGFFTFLFTKVGP